MEGYSSSLTPTGGIFQSVYANGAFSKAKLLFRAFTGDRVPSDSAIVKIAGKWFMYFGQHTEGIFYATYEPSY